jgi:hypothetical protein
MKLPIYELKISDEMNEESSVSAIALVDFPAIKKEFLFFKEQLAEGMPHYTKDGKLWTGATHKDADGRLMTGETHTPESEYLYHEGELPTLQELQRFSIVNEDKRIISGALMIADELIYRTPNKAITTDHYVKFSAETIKSIAIKFAKNQYNKNVNLMHDPNQAVKGVTLFESWLTDKERGILPMKGFEDVPDGSWFGSFFVENEEVWQSVKNGDYKGFSVEGMFEYDEPMSMEENTLKKIEKLLNEIITD